MDTPVLKAIAALRVDMNTRWDSNDKKLDYMQKNIDHMNSEFASFKTKLEGVEKQVISADRKVEILAAENSKLKDEISDLQQYTRKNNIVISGIPALPRGANVFPLLEKMAEILQIQFYRTDINAAHWLPVRGVNRENQSILVSFVSRIVKHEWLLARRHRKRLMANEIDDKFPQTLVYMNDHLTQKSREIFNAARSLLRQEKLVAVWTSDGNVMARRSPGGRPFRVTSLQALTEKAPPPRAEGPVTVQGANTEPTP
jgi:archaellum component FlaC